MVFLSTGCGDGAILDGPAGANRAGVRHQRGCGGGRRRSAWAAARAIG